MTAARIIVAVALLAGCLWVGAAVRRWLTPPGYAEWVANGGRR